MLIHTIISSVLDQAAVQPKALSRTHPAEPALQSGLTSYIPLHLFGWQSLVSMGWSQCKKDTLRYSLEDSAYSPGSSKYPAR